LAFHQKQLAIMRILMILIKGNIILFISVNEKEGIL
jgi:hypothetical protein